MILFNIQKNTACIESKVFSRIRNQTSIFAFAFSKVRIWIGTRAWYKIK
jgi:hypothetical protein